MGETDPWLIDVAAIVHRIIAEQAMIEVEDVTPRTQSLDDLGIDSPWGIVEAIFAIEEGFRHPGAVQRQ